MWATVRSRFRTRNRPDKAWSKRGALWHPLVKILLDIRYEPRHLSISFCGVRYYSYGRNMGPKYW